MLNRKGNATGVIVSGGVIAFVLLFGFFIFTTQTAIDEPQTEEEIAGAKALGTDVASVSVRTLDREDSAGNLQVSTTVYGWKKDSPKTIVNNGVTTSATGGTDTSLKGWNTGDIAVLLGFGNNTFYGGKLVDGKLVPQEFAIDEKSKVFELDVHRIIQLPQQVKIFDASAETDVENDDAIPSVSDVNITLDSEGSDSIDNLYFKINETNSSFYFNSIVFDTPADSNIKNIEVNGMVENTKSLQHFRDRQNYRFELSGGAKFYRDGDELKTGSVKISSRQDVVTEDVGVYFVDQQWFVSASDGIQMGAENDLEAEEDIGAGDGLITLQFSVN